MANSTYNFSIGSNTESYVITTAFRQQKERQLKMANNTECPPWAHIEGSIGNSGTLSFDALSSNGNASGTIVFRGIGFKFTAVADTGFTIVTSVYGALTKYYSQLTVSGKSFNNIQQLTPVYNAESQCPLKALYLQKGKGLVAYAYNADTFIIQ